jgi:hypothetical protein
MVGRISDNPSIKKCQTIPGAEYLKRKHLREQDTVSLKKKGHIDQSRILSSKRTIKNQLSNKGIAYQSGFARPGNKMAKQDEH